MKVLRHFQTNKPTSYNHSISHFILLHITLYSVCIRNITQSENTFAVYSRQWRTYRRCPRREEQLVICFCIHTSITPADSYHLLLRLYAHHLTIHPHINIKPLSKNLRSLDKQAIPISYNSPYIIREPTICI